MFRKLFLGGAIAFLAMTPLTAPASSGSSQVQRGIASYYHDTLHGRRPASGERYNKSALTAAHKTLPLGTKVRVTDVKSGKAIVVKINDRGPFVKDRVIDLSRRAARELGMIRKGLAKVRVEVIGRGKRG